LSISGADPFYGRNLLKGLLSFSNACALIVIEVASIPTTKIEIRM
jgi:hypothetical protein